MRLNKRLVLERHTYAPEMNGLLVITGNHTHIRRRASGAVSIREARHYLGWVELKRGLYAEVKVRYPERFKDLNKTFQGYVPTRALGLEQMRKYKAEGPHAKEPTSLVTGEILPVPKITIHFHIRGN